MLAVFSGGGGGGGSGGGGWWVVGGGGRLLVVDSFVNPMRLVRVPSACCLALVVWF